MNEVTEEEETEAGITKTAAIAARKIKEEEVEVQDHRLSINQNV